MNDRIIAINGVNILRMHHGEIVNLIRDSGNVVTLTVGPPEGTFLFWKMLMTKSFIF